MKRILAASLLCLPMLSGPTALRAAPTAVVAPEARARRVQELRKKIEVDNRNHPVQSILWAEEGLRLTEGGANPRAEIAFLLDLVRDLNTLDNLDRASSFLERARGLVAHSGTPLERFQLEVEASALLRAQERYADCKALLDGLLPQIEAFAAKRSGDAETQRMLGRAYRISGVALGRMGLLADAIHTLQKAQQVYERIEDKRGEGLVLNEMATLSVHLGRLEDAERLDLQSIALAETVGDLDLQASFRLELSNTYASQNDADRQLAELQKAAQLAARAQDDNLALTIAVNLADVFLRKKDYRSTLKHADEALRLAQAANDPFSVALCRVNRGIALNRLGNAPDGLRDIQAGLDHFKASPDKNYTIEITGILSEEYAFAGDYRRAYETQVAFKTLNDAFLREADRKRAVEAGAAFENDKKQFQIDALQRERHNQSRLRLLWIGIGALGFSTAIALVIGRKRLQAANRALAEMSLRDPLTALANRRYLATRIEEDLAQIHRLHRNGRFDSGSREKLLVNIDVVFLMIDIDHFKQVNDHFGHAAGDAVLKQFSAILTGTMRDSDTVVRWGGEEFFVVAKHTSRGDAHTVAERIRARVAEFPFELGNAGVIHKTCSIGFASYPFFRDEPTLMPWERVVEMADQCLYAAKASGRDAWVGVHATSQNTEEALAAAGGDFRVADLIDAGSLSFESSLERPLDWGGTPP